MGRVLAIDYGAKRCGVAVSDEAQIIASGLEATSPENLVAFLVRYCEEEVVDTIVFGKPQRLFGGTSDIEKEIGNVIQNVKKALPLISLEREDERFTSKIATQSLHQMGAKKKHKKNKSLIDEISATLILQSYLERKSKSL